MIINLLEQGHHRTVSASICVIGAGIAGLLLATRLRARGIDVVVLESGGLTQESEEHPLNRVVNLGTVYEGAMRGRARCLGGTSTRWGGALLPFLEHDLAKRPYLDLPRWPVTLSELVPFIAEIEQLFGLDDTPYDDSFLQDRRTHIQMPTGDPDFMLRFAKWPPFRKRNVATLLKNTLQKDSGIRIWLNATVRELKCDPMSGRALKAVAVSESGHELEVVADRFVLCAGAIETTRLLLLLNRQHGNLVFDGCEALGRYFHDHLSLRGARLVARNVDALNRLAGFRFSGTNMRSLRFELSPAAQVADRAPSAFGHISVASDGPSGFDLLRDFLRKLQKNGHANALHAVRLLRDAPYLVRAAYWRFIRQQLLWPSPATYELHIVGEQVPRAANKITLAAETDALGCPLACLDWRVEPRDLETIRVFARRFNRFWERHALDQIATVKWLIDLDGGPAYKAQASDIFHPGGTTRMGMNKRTAVVNADLRTFAVPNLWVASTSIFPSGASANPTLMLMAFTLRLAEHLAKGQSGITQHTPLASFREEAGMPIDSL